MFPPGFQRSYDRPRRLAATLLLLPALTVLAACSPDDSGADAGARSATSTSAPQAATTESAQPLARAPAAGPANPCTLMSTQEISAVAGLGANTGEPSTSGGAQVCTWADSNGKSAVVQVHASANRYAQSREAFESFYGGRVESVDIGEQGFYIGGRTGPLPTATVGARAGGAVISAQVMELGGDAAALRGQAMELARKLLQKL